MHTCYIPGCNKSSFRSFGQLANHQAVAHPMSPDAKITWMHDEPKDCNCGQSTLIASYKRSFDLRQIQGV